MNVMWLCNTPLPQMAKTMGIHNYKEGWLEGISSQLCSNVCLSVIFPQNKRKSLIKKRISNIRFYGYSKENSSEYSIEDKKVFKRIIQCEKPDVIHIFGTEYAHCLEMCEVEEGVPIIVSIQGLVSVYAEHYLDGIPFFDAFRPIICDRGVRCMYEGKKQFEKRGIYEKQAIKKCINVIGRTDWDRTCVREINDEIRYFFCNETLRNSFYDAQWNQASIKRYSIFVSQGNYSVKGIHYLLEALPMILKKFPKCQVNVAGDNGLIINRDDPYGVYIRRLLRKKKLQNIVKFIGFRTEEQMRQEYLNANVMVMCSNIENSPNCVGEAMLIGTPVVASYVGGVSNLLEHGKEGFLYQHNAPYMLAHYVCEVFQDISLADIFSSNGRKKAHILYNQEENMKQLMSIYKTVINKKE